MAVTANDLKPMRLYSSGRKVYLPFNEEDKKKGSAIFLMTPNIESSVKTMQMPYFINKKSYESYYLERDCSYIINHENHLVREYNNEYIPIMEAVDESVNDISNVYFGSTILERVEGDRTIVDTNMQMQFIGFTSEEDIKDMESIEGEKLKIINLIDEDHAYVTSDLHLFKDYDHGKQYVDELIRKINFKVKPTDVLIICGDLMDTGSREEDKRKLKYFTSSLKCKNIVLILGNNDILKLTDYIDCGITYVNSRLTVTNADGRKWKFSHYPCDVDENMLNFCGHLHSSTVYWNITDPSKCINVGYPNVKNNRCIYNIRDFLMKRAEGDYKDNVSVNKDLKEIQESIHENMIFSKEDIELNLDKWGSDKYNNILYITGFSGSGKSTLSRKYNNVEVISLDQLYQGVIHTYTQFGKTLYNECEAYREYVDIKKSGSKDPTAQLTLQCLLYILKKAEKSYPEKRFVMEGIQIYRDVPRELIYGRPLIIKGTSALTSAINRLRREDGFTTHTLYKGVFSYFKWYSIDNKLIKGLEKDYKSHIDTTYYIGSSETLKEDTEQLQDNLILNKGTFITTKDLNINVEKWGTSPHNNVLFITGLFESRDIDLALDIQENFGPKGKDKRFSKTMCDVIELESLRNRNTNFGNSKVGKVYSDVFNKDKAWQYWCEWDKRGEKTTENDNKAYLSYFVGLLMHIAETIYPHRRMIITGHELSKYVDRKYIMGRPLIVKGTSVVKAAKNALDRLNDSADGGLPFKTKVEWMFKYLNWFHADDKTLKDLKMHAFLNKDSKTRSAKDLTFNDESYEDNISAIKSIDILKEDTEYNPGYLLGEDAKITTLGLQSHDRMIIFNEMLDEEVFYEATKSNNGVLKRLLYQDRLKSVKDINDIYKVIKERCPWIRYTRYQYKLYAKKNLFIDTYYYTDAFFRNNFYKLDKAAKLYFDYMDRYIDDKRLAECGYTNKSIFIPISAWKPSGGHIWNYKESINPISVLYYMMKNKKLDMLKSSWGKCKIFFLGDMGYFVLDLQEFNEKQIMKFKMFTDSLAARQTITEDPEEDDPMVDSTKAITTDIINRIEKTQHIKIDYITGKKGQAEDTTKTQLASKAEKNKEEFKETGSPKTKLEIERDEKKKQLVERIETVAARSNNAEEAIEDLDNDEFVKQLLIDLAAEEDNAVKVSAARASRMIELNDKFHQKKIDGISVKQMLDEYQTSGSEELTETALPIHSVNEEWQHMKFMNFNKDYNMNEDIVAILDSFATKTVPVSVRDINIENTTTSEDLIETWTVALEDVDGSRFTLKFDLPKFKNGNLLRLRGNDKALGGQLMNLPIIKTDPDTCQITSNYNKIFIRTYGTSAGKSFETMDRILKALKKIEGKTKIKWSTGDNSKICAKYELPIDYIDMATQFNYITIGVQKFYFNQDELREKYKVDPTKGLPIGYDESKKEVIYWDEGYWTFSDKLLVHLNFDDQFQEAYNQTKPGVKYTYSKASILNTEIPVIVIMGYNEGLTTALKKANIKYALTDKNPSTLIKNPDTCPKEVYEVMAFGHDIIKFQDGYLIYQLNYSSSLLMNGLKECDTQSYSIKEINTKAMWVNFLDEFGGRIRADGLDNFYDLMVDPITKRVCAEYGLPDDYCTMLAYANMLLADNKYNRHTDLSGNRYRYAEIVAAHAYKCIAKAYADYRTMKKRSARATMSMKQSAIIDSVLLENTLTDSSTISEINYVETSHNVSFKGLSGMNSDRSYGLDKRTYDDSMTNLLAMSTGFASTVGVNRQTTVDMNIKGTRGFIKQTTNKEDMNDVNSLSITEALTPFGTVSDDPFRTAMTLVQTSKHSMRVAHGSPNLVTNGADDAIGYMSPDVFSYKSKGNGKVLIKEDDYMVLEYTDGTHEFVDLREKVYKNSDGGFFVTVKLDTDLKVGNRIKNNQIVAFDKLSYTSKIGYDDNPTLNNGMLTKVAICTTQEGYEDSGIMSEWFAKAMSSDVVVEKEVVLPKNTNVYNIVKKGQPIQEGDPLIIFQHAFDDADVNALLKNLTDDEDVITDIGRIPVRSKITGVVQDIIIYRTVEKEELSDSLRKIVDSYESNINKTRKVIEKYDAEKAKEYDSNYKLEATGKLKDAADSVKIIFYLKYKDDMSIGDKTVMNSALKSVIQDIFPEGEEPTSEFRPDEPIESFLAMSSVNARMVTSVFRNGLINKAMVELDRKVKEMNGLKWKTLREM